MTDAELIEELVERRRGIIDNLNRLDGERSALAVEMERERRIIDSLRFLLHDIGAIDELPPPLSQHEARRACLNRRRSSR